MEPSVQDCLFDGTSHGASRDRIPLLDKAIGLTWTLREQYMCAMMHLMLLAKRGVIEVSDDVGEEGKRRVSDTILRALRRLDWSTRMSIDEPFHPLCFCVLLKLHELGVHLEAAEGIFHTRFRDMEKWEAPQG
jgi:hypothetical protein